MAGSPERAGNPTDGTVLRFGPRIRLLHWAHAIPFLFLLLTGLSLFIPPVKAVHVDGYRLVPLLHVTAGIAFILSPIPLYFSLRRDGSAGSDLRRLFRFERADGTWARYALGAVLGARVQMPPIGKFNAGQKANTIFTVLVTAGLMATGAVLAVNFFTKRVFSASFVEQVFPFHDLFMLIALPVVAAHIYLGSINPDTRESLRAITRGRVRHSWALSHHALWVEEIDKETPKRGV
jgi:formate dehydrogenase subunit gamma